MRLLLVSALGATMALAGSAFAQQPSGGSSTSPAAKPSLPNSSATTNQSTGTAQSQQQVRQELEQAGFKDVQFIESAYVVQATSKDGNKVVMMISPHQVSAIESLNMGQSGQQNGNATTGSAAPSSPSLKPSSPSGSKQ